MPLRIKKRGRNTYKFEATKKERETSSANIQKNTRQDSYGQEQKAGGVRRDLWQIKEPPQI